MIIKKDVEDFIILYERMFKDYVNVYEFLEGDFKSIMSYTSMLLDNTIITPIYIQGIISDVSDCFYILEENMFYNDYIYFVLDYLDLLEVLEKEYIKTEDFEICNNIKVYVDRLIVHQRLLIK